MSGFGQLITSAPITAGDFFCALPGAGFLQYCTDLANQEVYNPGELPMTPPPPAAPPAPPVSATAAPASGPAAEAAVSSVIAAQVANTQAGWQGFFNALPTPADTTSWLPLAALAVGIASALALFSR